MKDLDEAATNFRVVLTRDSKHAGSLSGLGRVAFEQKRYADAIDLLQSAIALKIHSASSLLSRPDVCSRGKKGRRGRPTADRNRLEHDEAQQRRIVLRIQDEESGSIQKSEPKK